MFGIENLLRPISGSLLLQQKLSTLNIESYWDLLLHLPIRYLNLNNISAIATIAVDEFVVVQGLITSISIIPNNKKKILQICLNDNTAELKLIFFNFFKNYKSQFSVGKNLKIYGNVSIDKNGVFTIIHPKIITPLDRYSNNLLCTPIYSTVKGLSQNQIIKLVDQALKILDTVDFAGISDNNLFDTQQLKINLRLLHKLPLECRENHILKNAKNTIKLHELVAHQLLLQKTYKQKKNNRSIPFLIKKDFHDSLINSLPFKLTSAQIRVIQEIYDDLSKNVQMNRLLQGDVGSGKTIIALLTMLIAVENSYQACLVAPTEILAKQHFEKINKLLSNFAVEVLWLSGDLSSKQKTSVYNKIKSFNQNTSFYGQIIIGTHAIFQEKVEFSELGLIIIDEQHRFGVKQRLQLQNKGYNPHYLMLSATPIPRTLAMSYYADLDISIIDELPKSRLPIITKIINYNRRTEVIKFIENSILVNKDQQIYWVCPLIDESLTLELKNVNQVFDELQMYLPGIKIALIHGKLKTIEKDQIMRDFSIGKFNVLIATSVIEVGVDVPNATIIIIENSERLGLATLHQLRGRVGRSNAQSICILLYKTPLSEVAKQRLKIIVNCDNGFKIADEDLKIRGPGEFLGLKQSGISLLKFTDLINDVSLIPVAKTIAQNITSVNNQYINQYISLWFNQQMQLLYV